MNHRLNGIINGIQRQNNPQSMQIADILRRGDVVAAERMVRDLCSQNGKNADQIVTGLQTEYKNIRK